ncbi:MAG: STAS domain-containing protein [Ruminococcaceae bacterium]|nr:STAS domain-containing protein [Oscillospiraceae bacterium]
MKQFKPMLFSDLRHYSGGQLAKDLIAGVIVAIIALPLSIALAIASGVSPEAGIYTAIIAGFITAFFGGSSVQISGPTAAFATIVAGIVLKNGTEGLALATIMAGIILIIMGFLKFGNLIKFIPYTITTGFTAGIAVTLVVGQLKDFFGVTYASGETPIETIEKLTVFFENIGSINYQAIIVGAVCLAILFIWPKIYDKVPASLLAVAAGIIMVKGIGMDVKTIGDLYTLSPNLPAFKLPAFSIDKVITLFPDAFTIALLAGIESLLSCVVADGMAGKKHRSNAELLGQGLGNIASALFGGIPATGAIARTAANVKNGGRTPIAGMVHAVVLLLVLVILMPYAAWIPMPAIAAILISVAYNMCQWRQFVRLTKTSPKSDIAVLVITFLLTVIFDLVVAIEVGLVLACVLFMRRMSSESKVESWRYVEQEQDPDSIDLKHVPKHISVYELSGPLFFAVAGEISRIETKSYTKCVILRMRAVPSVDTDALRMLSQFVTDCSKKGITVILSHVNAQPMRAMHKSGLYDLVKKENFCLNIDAALRRGEELQ